MKKTINVLGTLYQVRVKKLKGDHGQCNLDKKVILIDASKGAFNETLTHEVVHGILFESGISHILAHTDGLEEAIVRAVEHGLKTSGLMANVAIDDWG